MHRGLRGPCLVYPAFVLAAKSRRHLLPPDFCRQISAELLSRQHMSLIGTRLQRERGSMAARGGDPRGACRSSTTRKEAQKQTTGIAAERRRSQHLAEAKARPFGQIGTCMKQGRNMGEIRQMWPVFFSPRRRLFVANAKVRTARDISIPERSSLGRVLSRNWSNTR